MQAEAGPLFGGGRIEDMKTILQSVYHPSRIFMKVMNLIKVATCEILQHSESVWMLPGLPSLLQSAVTRDQNRK